MNTCILDTKHIASDPKGDKNNTIYKFQHCSLDITVVITMSFVYVLWHDAGLGLGKSSHRNSKSLAKFEVSQRVQNSNNLAKGINLPADQHITRYPAQTWIGHVYLVKSMVN